MRRADATRHLRPPAKWSDPLKEEFAVNQLNACVGQLLVSETTRVRVWTIRLKPGERLGFHRHVLDYFWTASTAGSSISAYHDGRFVETAYRGPATPSTFASARANSPCMT
jgi:beta-alanine degradation protein BauB